MEQYRLRGELNDIDVDYFRDQAKPRIDLIASYGTFGLAGKERSDLNPISASQEQLFARVNRLSQIAGLPVLPPFPAGATPEKFIGGYGQARTAAEAHKAVVQAARKQVEAARGGFLAAKANLDNPAIRAAQSAAIEQQIRQAEADVQSAEAEAGRARAQLQEAEANRSDLRIVAPFDGTVATRSAEPGEVVSPGTPIMTIVNLSNVYLRAFIPEGEIGRVRAGQTARVYLDSNPKQPLDAVVARIDPQASFTPENTYYRDDRVKQVVGVKLQLVNSQGFAKPGMPADGEVLVEGDKWVATNRK
jgi:HlyD family secretion protein